jgi:two-component system sensor histidine kinase PilS (NtrC family)
MTPASAAWDTDSSTSFRLWRGFMTARIGIGVVLLVLFASLMSLGLAPGVDRWQVGLCAAYLAAAVTARLFTRPALPGVAFDPQWVSTIGIDLVAFSTLQFLQAAGLNFSPLFALPVLTASVLGSGLLALGTAAAVTLLLLVEAWLQALQVPQDYTARFVQAGLTGGGYFAVALLANQLAARLAREEQAARRSQSAARTQAFVNELVIETLSEGVLVIGPDFGVHAANPAARRLLAWQAREAPASLALASRPGWQPLVDLARDTFLAQAPQTAEAVLELAPDEHLHVRVRTRLTPPHDLQADALCVIFLEDLRETEARTRTEKLAAMGRMSAAVAHEIRNPLAAIAQANALLSEELTEPTQQQLSALVRKNAHRLSQIVEEILNLARVQPKAPVTWVDIGQEVTAACSDWASHQQAGGRLLVLPQPRDAAVVFESEHLRRVLINLLDNAWRYASAATAAIVVRTDCEPEQVWLRVWSDGGALDQGVQRHLFEPFFSSESRSSGLGLYICRELCNRHGATIAYRRAQAPDGSGRDGNEFTVSARGRAHDAPQGAPFDTIGA